MTSLILNWVKWGLPQTECCARAPVESKSVSRFVSCNYQYYNVKNIFKFEFLFLKIFFLETMWRIWSYWLLNHFFDPGDFLQHSGSESVCTVQDFWKFEWIILWWTLESTVDDLETSQTKFISSFQYPLYYTWYIYIHTNRPVCLASFIYITD